MAAVPLDSKKVYSISEITREVKELIEYNLNNVYITGEISNFRVPSSGHYYFTLKDEKAQIRAVMFRQTNLYMRFVPKDGMQILGRGRVSVYEPQGVYQIILDYMEPAGLGALKQAFDELKLKLKDEGLFDEAKKKKLPFFLKSVGVVTSPSGAAIRDFLSTVTRRFPNIHVIIYPAKVQGADAESEIAKGIEYFNSAKNVDAIVLTRGGGSFEDLFCFSKEIVARAVYQSDIPVISAVGHEIDYSISDFVADVRAPTPTAAAELICAGREELTNKISYNAEKLINQINYILLEQKEKLGYYLRALSEPSRRIDDLKIRIDDLTAHLITLIRSGINDYKARINLSKGVLKWASPKALLMQKEDKLKMLRLQLKKLMSDQIKSDGKLLSELRNRLEISNPYKLLKKGYSIVSSKETNKIIASIADVNEGALLDVKLGEGSIECTVTKIYEN